MIIVMLLFVKDTMLNLHSLRLEPIFAHLFTDLFKTFLVFHKTKHPRISRHFGICGFHDWRVVHIKFSYYFIWKFCVFITFSSSNDIKRHYNNIAYSDNLRTLIQTSIFKDIYFDESEVFPVIWRFCTHGDDNKLEQLKIIST